jgi:outer membrane protein assembly factor BamA
MRHQLDASYQLRAGRDGLDSDFTYTRQLTRASYRIEHKNSLFLADFVGGHISGRPPLFERFTLGDSSTLRGWNKYELTPAGATRVVHQSVEYRYHGFAYFLDMGSVWSAGEDVRLRLASGVGFHFKHAFLTLGVPLNAERMRGVVILGMRY